MNKNTLSTITLVLAAFCIIGGLMAIYSPQVEPDLGRAVYGFCLGIVFAVVTWLLRRSIAKEAREKQRRDDDLR